MQMNKGVEWAVHACTLLAPLAPGTGLSLAALAAYHGVPAAYMAKQMQALSRAGIVRAARGQSGGYALARSPIDVSLWDIVCAIGGPGPAFRCTEIRQRGPCAVPLADCTAPCAIAAAFARAESASRSVLKGITLADIMVDVGGHADEKHLVDVLGWYGRNVTRLPD